jgi:hypothetical protein
MPLERQVITMPLAQGVDTKTDAKQVVAGKLLELENGVFTTLKAIRKRDGNVALGTRVTNGATQVTRIQNGAGLATYGNELLLADGESIYSYDQAADGWTQKGELISVNVGKNAVVRDTHSQKAQDGVTHPNGLQLYAWEDSSQTNSIRYAIIDSATNQTVVSSTLLASNAIKPRVLLSGNVFLVYWYDTTATTLKLAQLPVTTPNGTPNITTLTGVSADDDAINATSPNYDACVINGSIAVVFNNGTTSGATTLRMYKGSNPTQQWTSQAVIPYRSRSVTVFEAANSQGVPSPVVAFSTDNNSSPYTTSVRFAAYSFDLLSALGSGVVFSGLFEPRSGMLITGCSNNALGVGFEIYFATELGVVGTGKAVIGAGYAVTSSVQNWQNSVVPFAKAFWVNGTVYVPLVYQSPLQSTYFLISSDDYIVAKALSQVAGPRPLIYTSSPFSVTNYVMPMLASVTVLDGLLVRIAALEQAQLIGNGIATATGVTSLEFDFDDPQHAYIHATLGNNLHLSGGFVQMYDGVSVVEHGFHLYPEKGTVTATAIGSGGALSAGTYTYSVCYEWIDHQNNIHRSRPSEGVKVTTVNNDSVQVTVPYLQLTQKRGDRPVQIILYRTLVDGSILYRVSSLTSPPLNVIGGSTNITITDTLSDAVVGGTSSTAAYPLLYCQFLAGPGYEVPNDPAPPTGIIQLHRNRIWVVDSTNPLQLWYSKECGIGAPVEFNNTFVKQIDPRGGPITALATVDDKLLVFKKSHIFFIVGQGPTNTNENNDLSDAILITTDCGCIEPRSVVGTPVGIMFQSAKGIYLIDRSLAVQYVGSPVEAYNNEVITSATLVSTTNQVRFTLESGKTLVFDYFVQQWGTFTNQYAVDSLVWQDTMVMLRSNGSVLKETPGVFTDAGSPIKLKLATSWLSFANVQGFQRVRRAQILGAWKSAHNLLVSVCVDFNDTIVQQTTVTPTTPTTYGGSSPYGSESVYGGTFQLYQWRVDLARQKTQAVKLILEDLPAATAGEGLSLTSLGFEVGAKTGLNKVPASQIVS